MANRTHPLTFLFTDIVGSTRLWHEHGAGMEQLLESHDAVIRGSVTENGGTIFAGGGDGFGIVFDDPTACLHTASLAQTRLASSIAGDAQLRVRMGTHTGSAQHRDGDFFGLTVNRAARVASAAHGGQILLTEAVHALVRDQVETTELGSFRLADLLEPVVLRQIGTESFPPPRALMPERHNLPSRYTSIVGRDALIEEVVRQTSAKRLITLVGPGGIGKTTVALAAAAQLATKMSRGAWLVELDALSPTASSDQIERATASALGMRVQEGWRRTAASREQLVVLDNAEHLIAHVADLAAILLRSGDEIRLLVTSREPLGVPGEHVVSVDPLPAEDAATSLFVDRSGLPTELDLSGEVAKLTDGIPLAIELVAAHASRLPPADVLASLRQSGLSTFTLRGVATRHSSAGATVAWSYDQLSPKGQRALRMLSIFPGDFTLRMAASVADTDKTTVRGLIEQSLVHPSDTGALRLLVPVREFARDQLAQLTEGELAMKRHAAAVADDIQRVAEIVPARGFAERWHAELDVSFADIERAFEHAIQVRDSELLERLYHGIPGPFPVLSDRARNLLDSIAPAVQQLETTLPTSRWSLFRHAWLEDQIGREPESAQRIPLLERAAAATDDTELTLACKVLMIRNRVYDRTFPMQSHDELEAQILDSGMTGVWWTDELLTFERAHHLMNLDRFEEALRALDRMPELGDSHGRSTVLGLRASILIGLGRANEAMQIHDELAGLPTDDHNFNQTIRQDRVHVLTALDRLDEAADLVRELVEEDLRDRQPSTMPYCAIADYYRATGEPVTGLWFLAKMLGDQPPGNPIHRAVVESARQTLGSDFDAEWERGKHMDILTLHSLVSED